MVEIAKHFAAAGLSLACIALLAGCARYNDTTAFQLTSEQTTLNKPYRVGPPDALTIESDQAVELNKISVTVTPDGTIDLPLVGSVDVAGKTTQQIARTLEEKASQYYRNVAVNVSVHAYRSKYIYVFGEVAAPGRYPFTGSNTLLELLSMAQPSRMADPNRIQLLRPIDGGNDARRMTVRLNDWIESGQTDRNAILENGDIVYVPPNGFARIGLAINNVLQTVKPAAQTVRGTATVEDQTPGVGRTRESAD